MAWSYRKRVKVIPGVYLNISRKGISTSIGTNGFSLNPAAHLSPVVPVSQHTRGNIFSVAPNEITTNDMQGIKNTILAAHKQRSELRNDLAKVRSALILTKIKFTLSQVFLLGLFKTPLVQKIKDTIASQQDAIVQIKDQIENSCMSINVDFDPEVRKKFEILTDTFKQLSGSKKVWDVTNAEAQNRHITRSAASTVVMKREVSVGVKNIPDVKSEFVPLWLKNANGADLYIYPGFIMMYDSHHHFGIIGLDELDFRYEPVRFVETGRVPADSKVIDQTWAKVNKNGTPDKRFKANYQIPIVRYGSITLKTKSGVHEEYEFSNYEATVSFGDAFSNYIRSVTT
jgi:hypothetical protein